MSSSEFYSWFYSCFFEKTRHKTVLFKVISLILTIMFSLSCHHVSAMFLFSVSLPNMAKYMCHKKTLRWCTHCHQWFSDALVKLLMLSGVKRILVIFWHFIFWASGQRNPIFKWSPKFLSFCSPFPFPKLSFGWNLGPQIHSIFLWRGSAVFCCGDFYECFMWYEISALSWYLFNGL